MAAFVRSLRRSRRLAMALIALALLGTTDVWHAEADDPDCGAMLVLHDHAAHGARVHARHVASQPAHCAICHWLRALQTGATRHASVETGMSDRGVAALARLATVRWRTPLHLPSRAPPLA